MKTFSTSKEPAHVCHSVGQRSSQGFRKLQVCKTCVGSLVEKFCPYEQLCHLLLGSAFRIQWTEDFHCHLQASQCRELECLPALLLLWLGPLLMVSDLLGRSQNCGGLVQTSILQYVAVDLWMYTTAKLAARLNLPRRAREGTRKGRLLENIWMPRQAIPPITMKPARVRLRPRTLSRVLVRT